ncbi:MULTISPECIES: Dps family protein [unclassified Microbacterium]|uniref:Dps family protein n=1 Tax=unclassified Microbacterium TaxID=2609290 RepID=UPI003745B005
MTDIQTTTPTATDPTMAASTAQFLSPVVMGLEALVVNGKQAHWHVRGSNFIGVHELLDMIVTNAQAWADLAAERIVALGLPVDSRLQTVAAKAKPTSVPAAFAPSDVIIRAVISDIDAVLIDLQTAVDGLDETDLTSQDVAIEIKRGLDKDRWFLYAHIAA